MSAFAPPKTSEAKKERRDVYQLVTDTIIDHLEEGIVPWRCPWNPQFGKPRNFHTGKTYRGINLMLLSLRRFASPFWLTFNQIKALGGSVRKGERGSIVVKYGSFQSKPEMDAAADVGGKPKKRLFLKEYVVFNAMQTDGIAFPALTEREAMPENRRIEKAEQIVANMPQPPIIMQGQRGMAAYKPSTDTVFMPPFGAFATAEDYHLTLFHECIHATGHESRLNRKTLVDHDGFGGKVYSQEELVAEMGAAFLGLEADIVQDNNLNAAAYIQHWLDVLREPDHKRWLVKASNQAARAADFILGIQQPMIADAPNS
jgi:antirestriction protein ArdC